MAYGYHGTPKQLGKKIEEYFSSNKTPTLHSLLFHCGISRTNVYDWKTYRPEMWQLIEIARERIIALMTELVVYGNKHKVIDGGYFDIRGALFYLKNIARDEFSDNPSKVEEIKQASQVVLTIENKGTNKLNLDKEEVNVKPTRTKPTAKRKASRK